jgi:flavin reductase (DIM6/NTAB) family NADH-FMN oxidoreductase RutF
MLWPLPVVLVACQGRDGPPNLLTVVWTGIVCSRPPLLAIAVTPERHSHALLLETGRFSVNLPTTALVRAVDLCGVTSGRDVDKWQRTGLTPAAGTTGGPPLVAECPVNLECRVARRLELGSHTLFIAEIEQVHVAAALIDGKGRLALERAGLLSWCHGHYYALGRQLGHFGFSVRRKPRRPRRASASGQRREG